MKRGWTRMAVKGMEEALAPVFPATTLQTCIVHLLRQSLDFANWKQRKPLAAALRTIYRAPSADLALAALDAFEHGERGQRCPTILAAWRRAWSAFGSLENAFRIRVNLRASAFPSSAPFVGFVAPF